MKSESYPVISWNNAFIRNLDRSVSPHKSVNLFQSHRVKQSSAGSTPVLQNIRVRSSNEHNITLHPDNSSRSNMSGPELPCRQIFKPTGRLLKRTTQGLPDRTYSYLWKNASALYGILAAMSSICLMLSSHLTHNIDTMYSRWFDCAMMGIGIGFLTFFVLFSIRPSKPLPQTDFETMELPSHHLSNRAIPVKMSRRKLVCLRIFKLPSFLIPHGDYVFYRGDSDNCSFYLKMGALVFAIGSMVYTCLEMGVFVENQSCFNVVTGIEPCFFVIFVMLQLYFIFRSSQAICWFGTIHLVATDICIWVRILIDETLHEFIVIKAKKSNTTDTLTETHDKSTVFGSESEVQEQPSSYAEAYARGPLCLNEESIMKDMLEKASTFLYPCTVEYTLITAGILFTMWSTVGAPPVSSNNNRENVVPRTRYSIDCDQASRGLFAGVVVGVLTVVGIILFFVFIDQDAGKDGYDDHVAVLTKEITEIILNALAIPITGYCMWQFAVHFQMSPEERDIEKQLTDSLLMLSMVGVHAYCVVSLLGANQVDYVEGALSLVAGTMRLLATSVQTIFIIDAGKRSLKRSAPGRGYAKPGREALTFLLFLNFALWAANVFCALRVDASPVQRDFFGAEGWAVILHITVPLLIFYRFHSTVCLVDIWKRAYKSPKPKSPRGTPRNSH